MTEKRTIDKLDKIQKLRGADYCFELNKYFEKEIQPFLNGTPKEEIPKKLMELFKKKGFGERIKSLREKHHITSGNLQGMNGKKTLYQLSPVNLLCDFSKIGYMKKDLIVMPSEYFGATFNPLFWAFYLNANNQSVDLRIDLTWDKKDLKNAFDDLVTMLQKKIKKIPEKGGRKDAVSSEVAKIIENYLTEYYVNDALSLEKALELISRNLEEYGFKIEADSIKSRYLPALKEKYGIKKITELRSKMKMKEDK